MAAATDGNATEWRVIEIMECKVIPFHTVEERSKTDADKAEALLSQAMGGFHKKLVVLDDDPTGVQTVHDVSVYTDWEEESIRKGFEEKESMFFILTNSRSFSVEETTKAHLEIAARVAKVAGELGQDFMIISRGDSTLRGHYPLETQLLAEGLADGIQTDQRKRQQTMALLQGAQLLTVRSSARFFQKAAATQWTISTM